MNIPQPEAKPMLGQGDAVCWLHQVPDKRELTYVVCVYRYSKDAQPLSREELVDLWQMAKVDTVFFAEEAIKVIKAAMGVEC